MDKLGKILTPVQYDDAGEDVRFDNSEEALEFFERFYPKGGTVLLGDIFFDSEEIPSMLSWFYFDVKGETPQLISMLPVFNVPLEELEYLDILDTIPHLNEVFISWHDVLYCSVYTTNDAICIKRVRCLLDAEEAKRVIEMNSESKVDDIYPVELYCRSEHKFIGVCWAVTMVGDSETVLWHPVCLEEVEKISSYSTDDITEYLIKPGETAVICGKTFVLCTSATHYPVFLEMCKSEENGEHSAIEVVMPPSLVIKKQQCDSDPQHKAHIVELFPRK